MPSVYTVHVQRGERRCRLIRTLELIYYRRGDEKCLTFCYLSPPISKFFRNLETFNEISLEALCTIPNVQTYLYTVRNVISVKHGKHASENWKLFVVSLKFTFIESLDDVSIHLYIFWIHGVWWMLHNVTSRRKISGSNINGYKLLYIKLHETHGTP